MKIIVLGSGTSSGVPVVGCPCAVCHSTNPKNRRLRSSCYVETDGLSILIDTSPDLRMQALTHHINKIDAVLFTHTHADHVHGIDDLRVYNLWQKNPLPIYSDEATLKHLEKKFSYVFGGKALGYPSLVPHLVPNPVEGEFKIGQTKVTMIPCHHGTQWTQNYRIGNFAWLTDTSAIPDSSLELLQGLEVLFLDGLRPSLHPTHFNLEAALNAAQKIGAQKTYLIHLAHDYDHDRDDANLPPGISLAYDGLTVEI